MKERWQNQWEKERKRRWFYKIQRKTGEMRRRQEEEKRRDNHFMAQIWAHWSKQHTVHFKIR